MDELLSGHNSSTLAELSQASLCELAWDVSTAMGPCPLADLIDQLANRLNLAEVE